MGDVDSFSLAKFFKPQKTDIDNLFFWLHYRFTFVVLLFSCSLVSVLQLREDAISCIKETDVPPKIMERYCWISGTYSVFHPNDTHEELPYRGVRNSASVGSSLPVHHTYYQWVPLVLFLQAITFYTPYFVWKRVEGGCVSALVNDIDGFTQDDQLRQRISTVAKYFCSFHNTRTFYQMAVYFCCEMANLINITLQISFLNHFINQEYDTFGFEYLNFMKSKELVFKMNPMNKLFPHVTKCTFHSFGSSGDVQKVDTLCVLMVNVLNEKIFLFLWFYFLLIFILTIVSLFRTALHLAIVKHYHLMMNWWLRIEGKPYFYRKQALKVFHVLSYPDYFSLHLILKNLSVYNGYYLLKNVEKRLETDSNFSLKVL